jgi:hypothetical protein
LAVQHARHAWRPLLLYVAVVVAAVSPYLGWLTLQHRLVATGVGGAGALVEKLPGVSAAPIHLDLSRGLYHIGPAPPPLIVRWRADIDSDRRASIEQRFGLHPSDQKADGRSVLYRMDDPSPSRVLALVTDPRVEDTAGVDRGDGRLLPPVGWKWWTVHVPLLRLEPSTLFHTTEDAEGWIYYLFLIAPAAATFAYWRWPDRIVSHAGLKVLSLIICGLIIDQVFLLGQIGPRLPDVAGVIAVLLVWSIRRLLDVSRVRDGVIGVRTIATMALVLVLAAITWRAVVTYSGNGLRTLVMAGVVEPAALTKNVQALHQRPLTYWLSINRTQRRVEGMPALTEYLAACLAPDDRPLLVAYAPEVYYLSEHLFPGGINKFDPSGFNPTSAQILRWLRGQSVPLVIVEQRDQAALQEWTDLGAYVRARYRPGMTTAFDGDRPFQFLVDVQRIPVGVDPRWGLPCFV